MKLLLRVGEIIALTCLLQACNPIGFIEANRLIKDDEDAFRAAKADFVVRRPLILAPNEVVAAAGELELKYRIESVSAKQLGMQRSGPEFSIPNLPTWHLRGSSVNIKYVIEKGGGRLIRGAVNEKTVGKNIEVNRTPEGRFEAVRITVRDGNEITAQFDGWFPSNQTDPIKSSVATKELYYQFHHPLTVNNQPVSINSSVGKITQFLNEAFVKIEPQNQLQASYQAAIVEDTKYEQPVDFNQSAAPPELGNFWDRRCDELLVVANSPGAGGYSYRFRRSTAQARVIVQFNENIHCYGDEVFVLRNQNGNNALERYSQVGEFVERLKIEQDADLKIGLGYDRSIVNPASFERSGKGYRWTYLFVDSISLHHWAQGKSKTLPVLRRIDIELKPKSP
jgi:hypothetical protein